MKDLIVIIPVYNESEIIQEVVKDWSDCLDNLNIDYLIKVYNDGSSDNTLLKLNALKADYKNLEIIDKPNSGHGPTILKGYLNSLDSKWLFQVDSDNEITASNFERFWDIKGDYDFIIGTRINRQAPISRKIITKISNTVVGLFFGFGIMDCNAPFRLLRTEAFMQKIQTIPQDTFAPNVIVSGLAVRQKMRYKNISVTFEFRKTGEVSINKLKLLKASLRSFKQTIIYALKH